MTRLPFLPTLVVAAAVAVMIGLGLWQLQRADWKEGMIARIGAARTLSPIDLGNGAKPDLEFRRVLARCSVASRPEARGGQSRDGRPGFIYVMPCRDKDAKLVATLDIGWSANDVAPDRIEAAGPFSGMLRKTGGWEGIDASRYVLVLDRPLAGLGPSAQPSAEAIPNNHRLYAVQWFFFAAAAGLIYALALRRRQRPKVAAPPASG